MKAVFVKMFSYSIFRQIKTMKLRTSALWIDFTKYFASEREKQDIFIYNWEKISWNWYTADFFTFLVVFTEFLSLPCFSVWKQSVEIEKYPCLLNFFVNPTLFVISSCVALTEFLPKKYERERERVNFHNFLNMHHQFTTE